MHRQVPFTPRHICLIKNRVFISYEVNLKINEHAQLNEREERHLCGFFFSRSCKLVYILRRRFGLHRAGSRYIICRSCLPKFAANSFGFSAVFLLAPSITRLLCTSVATARKCDALIFIYTKPCPIHTILHMKLK